MGEPVRWVVMWTDRHGAHAWVLFSEYIKAIEYWRGFSNAIVEGKDARLCLVVAGPGVEESEKEPSYPCDRCGCARTVAEGGRIFTVCDECWDKPPATDSATDDAADGPSAAAEGLALSRELDERIASASRSVVQAQLQELRELFVALSEVVRDIAVGDDAQIEVKRAEFIRDRARAMAKGGE